MWGVKGQVRILPPLWYSLNLTWLVHGWNWPANSQFSWISTILSISFYWRFLDDIFIIFEGSPENLHSFVKEINKIHLSIKFTMTQSTPENINPPDCECKTTDDIPFLDTSIKMKDGKLVALKFYFNKNLKSANKG